ncbi:hypothetical protein [Aliidiomarina quisquiliarum]|uniref:hypothetical protein n=1 Tax=Aliidiomarina quisquiliarum TaxID=2938947 RepID=UPI00208FEBFC|nr:hypothetical protein [Aliidiomarina quisquiliarum]MCO4320351.1 hypothetical protein [Aliidiomarina quisquiliarum]
MLAKRITAFDIEDTHTFEGKEKEQVTQRGFVGMAISQRKVIDENGCFDDLLVLSVFAPCEASRLKILGIRIWLLLSTLESDLGV